MLDFKRHIAAFVLFVLASVIVSPAMAATLSCAMDAEEEGCCCAKDEATAQPNYAAPGCECPSCACTIEQSQTPQPWYPTSPDVQPELLVATVTAALRSREVGDAPREAAKLLVQPRGPPGNSAPPLYILYDTYLI